MGELVHLGERWSPPTTKLLPDGWKWEIRYFENEESTPSTVRADVIVERLGADDKVAERRAMFQCFARDAGMYALLMAQDLGLQIAGLHGDVMFPGWVPYEGWYGTDGKPIK